MTPPIETIEEFCAHALALEREAAARYDELAAAMDDCGNRPLAALFRRLAADERGHAARAADFSRSLGVTVTSATLRWPGFEAPECAAHAMVHWRMSPLHGLRIALSCEQRAVAFFESMADRTSAPEVRLLALECAAEEREHVSRVLEALARESGPQSDGVRRLGGTGFAGKAARLP